tara:strand:- start:44 stop:481 length:438 start_codon:yes stop_codon:yes gene_type:complete
MAKKQKSFAEKAEKDGSKDLVHVKYVKSVPSNKEGFWRFNESMITMVKGQNLEVALKEMDDAANLVDIEMPTADAVKEVSEVPVKVAEAATEEASAVADKIATEVAPAKKTLEAVAVETPVEKSPQTKEAPKETAVKEATEEKSK